MTPLSILTQVAELSLDERIVLVQEIWDRIAEDRQSLPLTEAQRAVLNQRLEAHKSNPEQVVAWEKIKSKYRRSE